ncbi:hypothetical protein HK101_004992 [Irineochytrium annulatum]|nr:hypothetical protein HK101_004992 [Irineochytrium annulatum]
MNYECRYFWKALSDCRHLLTPRLHRLADVAAPSSYICFLFERGHGLRYVSFRLFPSTGGGHRSQGANFRGLLGFAQGLGIRVDTNCRGYDVTRRGCHVWVGKHESNYRESGELNVEFVDPRGVPNNGRVYMPTISWLTAPMFAILALIALVGSAAAVPTIGDTPGAMCWDCRGNASICNEGLMCASTGYCVLEHFNSHFGHLPQCPPLKALKLCDACTGPNQCGENLKCSEDTKTCVFASSHVGVGPACPSHGNGSEDGGLTGTIGICGDCRADATLCADGLTCTNSGFCVDFNSKFHLPACPPHPVAATAVVARDETPAVVARDETPAAAAVTHVTRVGLCGDCRLDATICEGDLTCSDAGYCINTHSKFHLPACKPHKPFGLCHACAADSHCGEGLKCGENKMCQLANKWFGAGPACPTNGQGF